MREFVRVPRTQVRVEIEGGEREWRGQLTLVGYKILQGGKLEIEVEGQGEPIPEGAHKLVWTEPMSILLSPEAKGELLGKFVRDKKVLLLKSGSAPLSCTRCGRREEGVFCSRCGERKAFGGRVRDKCGHEGSGRYCKRCGLGLVEDGSRFSRLE